MSWLDDLETWLDSQLADALRANPGQEALLAEQERRDRQERLRRQRLQLQEEAERSRAALLQLASEIRSWQERVERARAAGAHDLASRAEAHGNALMEQGRQRWQALAALGERFSAVEWELSQLGHQAQGAAAQPGATPPEETKPGSSLGDDWAAFEAEQELEALRQRLKR